MTPRVAVLLPCYNEEAAIATVVAEVRAVLPATRVYVYDNNSTDRTAERARAAGAQVRREDQQGKGHVVRRMFADVDADVYLLTDGDGTYDVSQAPALIARVCDEGLDMISGLRRDTEQAAYRVGHRFGNRWLSTIVSHLFGRRVDDMLSGYRVMSRRFVKSFPVLSTGFEIETELTIHALGLKVPMAEVATVYRARAQDSQSKLRTLRDGMRILRTILLLLKEERPVLFFGSIFAALAASSVALSWPVFVTYMQTGLVPRFPTAILSTGMMLLAFMSLGIGLVLDSVARGRKEAKRMCYLGHAAPGDQAPTATDHAAADRAIDGSPRT